MIVYTVIWEEHSSNKLCEQTQMRGGELGWMSSDCTAQRGGHTKSRTTTSSFRRTRSNPGFLHAEAAGTALS